MRQERGGALRLLLEDGKEVRVGRVAAEGGERHRTITVDGLVLRVGVAAGEGEAFAITLSGAGHAGDTWSFRPLDPYAPPGGEAAAEGRLSAPIPGRVVQLLVKEGDAVERGQVLAVLEAMKTELRIAAPADGTVAHVGCAVGDSVEEGTEIVTLDVKGD